jgi:hypothetical protein
MSYFAPLPRIAGSIVGVIGLTQLIAAADPNDGLAKKMYPIYIKDVEMYTMAVESAPKKGLELKKDPVLEWGNRHRGNGTTQGTLFLWLRDGRPAAVACIFSYPHSTLPGRMIAHELHALDIEKLIVTRDAQNQWKPEAGLERKVLTDAPTPGETPANRLLQIKKLAAEFTGSSIDREKQRLELRLLPTPLYRYPTAKSGVIDGALFTLVADSSTDPEVLLLIEAKETDGKMRWEYACGRFSDLELHVQRKDKEVFSSIPGMNDPSSPVAKQLYRVYSEKVVSEEGKLLARIRNGRAVPEEDK